MEFPKKIAELIQTLPDNPGVYQYYDGEGKLIYIGKAKNLRKRVSSYFVRDLFENGKTAVMVRKVADIRHIIVDSEAEALLLENNLIKKHQPRYNILLRDDKTYPWIRITAERFPRVFSTRTLVNDGSQYFGPYSSVKVMNALLDLARQLYKPRICNYNLSEENIENKKFKICLEFHIGNCRGPCEGLQPEEDYIQSLRELKEILKGNIGNVIRLLRSQMKEHAEKLEFEKAQAVKARLGLLERFQGKSTVVNPDIRNADVFSIVSDEKAGYVNYLKVVNGAIVQGHTVELRKKLDESDEELLLFAITDLQQRLMVKLSEEVIVPFKPELEPEGISFIVPQRGDKKKLLELSQRNALSYKRERALREEKTEPERHTRRIMGQMMKDLRLAEEPRHIECFDNSNIQGAYPVSAMVVFKDARPSKKDYRLFNIKTVEGPDDFASMEEVIFRRYKKLSEENLPLPQLIIIDGGKGQLSAALNSLHLLGLRGKMGVISIAKKLEEIYYPDDPFPMHLDKKSETLRIIQYMRNEAHRFGIAHHRKRRSKGTIKTELTSIAGISDKTAQKLLRKFKSVKKVKEADINELADVIGPARAKQVNEHFRSSVTKQ